MQKPTSFTRESLKLPTLIHHDTIITAVPKKIYQNAHTYHINSISVNSDGESYLSADDLRINLWNLEISNQSFSILYIYIYIYYLIIYFIFFFIFYLYNNKKKKKKKKIFFFFII